MPSCLLGLQCPSMSFSFLMFAIVSLFSCSFPHTVDSLYNWQQFHWLTSSPWPWRCSHWRGWRWCFPAYPVHLDGSVVFSIAYFCFPAKSLCGKNIWEGRLPHCNENPIYVLPEKELRCFNPNFHTHMSISNFYISRISPHIFLRQKRQTDRGNTVYKSLTDTWMYKIATDASHSFFGFICFKFSVLCLCSVIFGFSNPHALLACFFQTIKNMRVQALD